MAQGTGSTAAIGASQAADKVSSVFIPAWGTQLKRLTVGNSKAELFYERKGFFMKPTLTQVRHMVYTHWCQNPCIKTLVSCGMYCQELMCVGARGR